VCSLFKCLPPLIMRLDLKVSITLKRESLELRMSFTTNLYVVRVVLVTIMRIERVAKTLLNLEEVAEVLRGKAKTIRFNSMVTNEEALMLQTLKDRLGVKLVNREVKAFQDFMGYYADATGKMLYPNAVEDLRECDFIVSTGAKLEMIIQLQDIFL